MNNQNLAPYLTDRDVHGILRIYNIQTSKSLLVASMDMKKDITSIRFQLDLGMYPNAELQKDYAKIGLELYAIEPYLICDNPEEKLDECRKKLEEEGASFY